MILLCGSFIVIITRVYLKLTTSRSWNKFLKKEKSLCKAKKSKPEPRRQQKSGFAESKKKSLANSDQGLGLINIQNWNSKKRSILKLNRFSHQPIFPLWWRAKVYNLENCHTITAMEFPQSWFCLLWTVGVPSFHWLVVYPVDIHLR